MGLAQFFRSLGYEVDKRGNVSSSQSQLAIVSLEETPSGGVLRIHGNPGGFFYEGDSTLDEKPLAFPSRVTKKFVYFEHGERQFRVERGEFEKNALNAFSAYNQHVKKKFAG